MLRNKFIEGIGARWAMRGRVKRMGKFNFFPSLIGLLFVYVATCMAFWWAQASSYMEVKSKRVTRIDGRMGVSAKVEKNGCLIQLQINHISQVLTLKPASALPSIAPLNPIRVCLTRMKNYPTIWKKATLQIWRNAKRFFSLGQDSRWYLCHNFPLKNITLS